METLTWSDGSLWLPLGLIPVTTAVSVSVTSGQALIVTGSSAVTITLPTHAAGQLCAVLNRSTGGTTVSGSSIQGVGLSSASSFSLGTVRASAMLLDDGTSWNLIAGQQDTGWVALTLLPSGVAAAPGSYIPSARLQADVVRLKGEITNNSGLSIASATNIFAVAAAMQNTETTGAIVSILAANGVNGFMRMSAQPASVNFRSIGSWSAGDFLSFDGCTYTIS